MDTEHSLKQFMMCHKHRLPQMSAVHEGPLQSVFLRCLQ